MQSRHCIAVTRQVALFCGSYLSSVAEQENTGIAWARDRAFCTTNGKWLEENEIKDNDVDGQLVIPARCIPVPGFLSEIARAYLKPQLGTPPYPPIEDKPGWKAYVSAVDEAVAPLLRSMSAAAIHVEQRIADDAQVFDITPATEASGRGIILEIHGGALILCGGELCRLMGMGTAARLRRRTWSVDYRMPPDHPYPAALDDCLAVYRTLLRERSPAEIVVSGGSAGGNLAAALMLRARDEGLPMPAGLLLATPEVDLTESGDSFHTNNGVDPGLRSLMPVNLLYANGYDLSDPYLSPLFGDLKGFPRTLLTTGTRDLYLSNTVRMHRKLRAAGVVAELHVTEAGPHTGFPGAPESREIDLEILRFLHEVLPQV
jgi:monoterpene epsilon-lactone hydrolase